MTQLRRVSHSLDASISGVAADPGTQLAISLWYTPKKQFIIFFLHLKFRLFLILIGMIKTGKGEQMCLGTFFVYILIDGG